MANKVNPPSDHQTTKPKTRRHVGSSADFVQTAPVIGSTSLPPTPTITPTLDEDSTHTASKAEPKPASPATPKPRPATPEPVRTDPGMFTFHMKQETAVLLLLVLGSLLLGAFLFGHRVGKYRTESNMARKASDRLTKKTDRSKSVPAARPRQKPSRVIQIPASSPAPVSVPARQTPAPAAASETPSGVWTLCVITYKAAAEKRAEVLKRVLSEAIPAQYKVFIKRSGNRRLVCVGHFNSSRDPVLTELKSTVSKLEYEKKKQFQDCYPVRLKR